MQDWELQQYQPAAIEMCYRLHRDPYETVAVEGMSTDGGPPRWVKHAIDMYELEMTITVMRQFGRPV